VTAMAARHKDASREALSRLPKLDIRELREEWCRLYKAGASPHLSRELLIRAVAYPQGGLHQCLSEKSSPGAAAKGSASPLFSPQTASTSAHAIITGELPPGHQPVNRDVERNIAKDEDRLLLEK
jgi:hypothetical protein